MKVERTFKFNKEYVSCSNCALNYNCQAAIEGRTERTFCQEFSIHIDPTATADNIERGNSCLYWVPEFADRSKMQVTEKERTRWYEKEDTAVEKAIVKWNENKATKNV